MIDWFSFFVGLGLIPLLIGISTFVYAIVMVVKNAKK